jgi:RNA-binding protein
VSNKILLGKVMHQSKSSNNLIITLNSDVKIGQLVIDKDGKVLGKIFDIFGPVKTPYASIKLNQDINLKKINEKPIFMSKNLSRKRNRRNRKYRKSR